MSPGAASPEELDTLLEDALLVADDAVLADLFEHEQVVVAVPPAHHTGAAAAALLVGQPHVASGRAVLLGQGLAVTTGPELVVISRQGPDRRWRLLLIVAGTKVLHGW